MLIHTVNCLLVYANIVSFYTKTKHWQISAEVLFTFGPFPCMVRRVVTGGMRGVMCAWPGLSDQSIWSEVQCLHTICELPLFMKWITLCWGKPCHHIMRKTTHLNKEKVNESLLEQHNYTRCCNFSLRILLTYVFEITNGEMKYCAWYDATVIKFSFSNWWSLITEKVNSHKKIFWTPKPLYLSSVKDRNQDSRMELTVCVKTPIWLISGIGWTL